MKVPVVFLLVTRALGVDIKDTVNDHTCHRTVPEGGVLAKTWLIKKISETTNESYQSSKHIPRANVPRVCLTISGDASTLRTIPYESCHSTLLLPTLPKDDLPAEESTTLAGPPEKRGGGQNCDEPNVTRNGDPDHQTPETLEGFRLRSVERRDHAAVLPNVAEQRGEQSDSGDNATPSPPLKPVIWSFGTWSIADHKSETQVQGWKDVVDDIFSTFKRSPMGLSSSVNPLEFVQRRPRSVPIMPLTRKWRQGWSKSGNETQTVSSVKRRRCWNEESRKLLEWH